ncbi:spindle and kinetochore-associated protein 3 isoform X2 [Monodelphis domestica]|uniref:spindle and kinetochore-associated protein 3 isoform X2 n=1 Tax=Monodelphis domestica TaxID=13616 RepID=UPI000443642B|nr:spindle and kinetochore-associated protein 3 isoform X2 [Monodelphis domestica]
MDPVGKFFGKLHNLAVTLERETAQLERGLNGEEADFEDSPMRILHDLHLEVKTLKDDVKIRLDKSHWERQESNNFIKNTKLLMERNTMNITKIRDLFLKYGYKPTAVGDPVKKEDIDNVKSEEAKCKNSQMSEANTEDMSGGSVQSNHVPQSPPHSPQLSDFGLEKYMFSRNLNIHPPAMNIHKQEQVTMNTPFKQTSPKMLKTPKCTLKMDEYVVETPKLEHFGISEHTMCLNNDYTMLLKNAQKNKSLPKNNAMEINVEAKSGGNNNIPSSGSILEQSKENHAYYANSPLEPVFFTPGLKIPLKNSNPVLNETKQNKTKDIIPPISGSSNLDSEVYTSLVLKSDKWFEHHEELSPPKISPSENLLKTPSPPEVTTIPDDIFQMLSRYNSKLATPVAFKPRPSKALFSDFK